MPEDVMCPIARKYKEEGMTLDGTGVEEAEGIEVYPFYDDASYTSRLSKDDDQSVLSATVSVSYRPADLDFLGTQKGDILPDETGSFTVMATDLMHEYALDGYYLDVESLDSDILEVLSPTVVTGGDGKVDVKLKGINPGKAKLKVSVNYYSEYYKRELKAEQIFEVRIGARTFEYMVDVDDDLKGRIQYTLSGRFSVWQDGETGEWHCNSGTTNISWAPGLQTMESAARIVPGIGKNGVIEMVFGDFREGMDVREVTGNIPVGVGEELNDAITFLMGGSVHKSSEYIPPMSLTMPVSEGTYNYKVEADENGDLNLDQEFEFGVSPNMYVLTSCAGAIYTKVQEGQTVFFTATATIREVDPE